MQVDEEAIARIRKEFRDKNPALFRRLETARRAAQLQKQR